MSGVVFVFILRSVQLAILKYFSKCIYNSFYYYCISFQNLNSPFFMMSKCSHNISPTKGGQRFMNSSLSILHRKLPFMVHMLVSMPWRLSSPTAHANHCRTCGGLHWAGSINWTQNGEEVILKTIRKPFQWHVTLLWLLKN